jgi:para-aminobenzoate synthetase component I
MFLPASDVFDRMNRFGESRRPFLFGIDFDVHQGFFYEPEEAKQEGIRFSMNGNPVPEAAGSNPAPVRLNRFPVSQETYEKAFGIVHRNLTHGNSYLVNLTFPTGIELNLSLRNVYERSRAPYRLLFRDEFVVFSPETFVTLSDGSIRSFPMKGTIDAALPDAERLILSDAKETAEHHTIVDLIRNDLSMVSSDVTVDRFRYTERIVTHAKTLIQVSSEISGRLPEGYHARLGSIMETLLPAGSISGAPKKKTLEIIREAETYHRGFYTGVFGFYDGERLDSAVMIRFIRKENGKFIFCSGGGITVNSEPLKEYNELIDKVYVPIF